MRDGTTGFKTERVESCKKNAIVRISDQKSEQHWKKSHEEREIAATKTQDGDEEDWSETVSNSIKAEEGGCVYKKSTSKRCPTLKVISLRDTPYGDPWPQIIRSTEREYLLQKSMI